MGWEQYVRTWTLRVKELRRNNDVLGDMFCAMSKYESALGYLQADIPEDGVRQVRRKIRIAKARHEMNNFQMAIDVSRDAYDELRQLEDVVPSREYVWLELSALTAIARAQQVLGDLESAERNYKVALGDFRRIREHEVVPFILQNLGAILSTTGRVLEAKRYLESAVIFAERIGEITTLVNALEALGAISLEFKDFETSMHHFDRALDLAIKTGNIPQQCHVRSNIGNWHCEKGNLTEACRVLSEALNVAQHASEKQRIEIMLNMFRVYMALRRLDDAERICEETLYQSRLIDDRASIQVALSNTGATRLVRGDCSGAAEVFRESLSIARDMCNVYSQVFALERLATTEGIRKNYDRSIRYLKEALALAKSTKNSHYVKDVLRTLAVAYLCSGNLFMAVLVFGRTLWVSLCLKLKR